MIRGLMSDEEWACLESFVIERGARSGRRPRDHRLVLDGIFWIAHTGVTWRDLHEHFGNSPASSTSSQSACGGVNLSTPHSLPMSLPPH